MPAFHPSEESLLEYASGAASEAYALLTATHLVLCPLCRKEVARLEAIGGALLDEIPPTSVAPGSLDAVLARLGQPAPGPAPARAVAASSGEDGTQPLPLPLRDYLPASLDRLSWKRYGASIEAFDLLPERQGVRARLLRIKAGRALPPHTHGGSEQSLVLAGGFSDLGRHYARGDVAIVDRTVAHRPIVDADVDCLCLIVTDAPLRLVGPLGRVLNRFIKF